MTLPLRVAVTGLGAVTPYGTGVPIFWDSLLANKSAVRQTTDEQLRQWVPVVAEALDFKPEDHLARKQIADTDRFAQLALVAAKEALADARLLSEDGKLALSQSDPDRIGISLGSASDYESDAQCSGWIDSAAVWNSGPCNDLCHRLRFFRKLHRRGCLLAAKGRSRCSFGGRRTGDETGASIGWAATDRH
nr:beta-ketoacyl synthase N-terminal-like domain-containing protein [Effusibacillus dendaii]